VFSKVRSQFLGGRLRYFITGAAPISLDILEFFWACGLQIFEAYGMSESTVTTHANLPGRVKLGTVGKTIPSAQCKIAEDGEILIKGPMVFAGYYKDEAATSDTVKDGWLYTGDIGSVDSDGYLSITDRKKHIIITSGGKNLTPANIEKAIKSRDPLISHVHAHGDKRAFVSAIIAPSPLETLDFGVERKLITREESKALTLELMSDPTARSESLNKAMSKITSDIEFSSRLAKAVAEGNKTLMHVEQVKKFYVLGRDFSQEQGEMTPTMKVKRKEIEKKFQEIFDQIYNDPNFAVNV
jgi:long-chain acyl-CoA synthetase